MNKKELNFHLTQESSSMRRPIVYLTYYDVTNGHNNREVVATASYNPLTCNLRTLSVERNRRGEGIGTRLLSDIERCMKRDGCSTCRVLAYPDDQHSFDRLHGFYRKNGYSHHPSNWWPRQLWNILMHQPSSSKNWMQKKLG